MKKNTLKFKSILISVILLLSIFLLSFFSYAIKFAAIPIPIATYSVGATVVEMTSGAIVNQATISSLDGRGVTRENVTTISSTGKFTVLADYFPFMVIVKPTSTNLVPAVYHYLSGRADTRSKANRIVVCLPSAATTTGPVLAVSVFHNVTEAAMVGANVVITNLTKNTAPTTLIADANGVVKINNFTIGDLISVRVTGMSADFSYTISTIGLPAKSYISSYSFVTP